MLLKFIVVLNFFAFIFVAYLIADVLAKALKEGAWLRPIAVTLCAITISYHLFQTDGGVYVLASFVGFFLHTCANAYVKKKKPDSAKKKTTKVNP